MPMTKTANPPAPPVERDPAPVAVPRVTYTTIEGNTTKIPAPADQADALPTEENK